MKILLVGAGDYDIHEPALLDGFKSFGYDADLFSWSNFFNQKKSPGIFSNFINHFQKKFVVGPIISDINQKLQKKVAEFKPDLVFIYRNLYIKSSTILLIQKSGTLIFSYNNDDPFSNRYRKLDRLLWRIYFQSTKVCDYNFVFRHKNIEDFAKLGQKNVGILRGFYSKKRCFKYLEPKKLYDVIFVGHFENDGRDNYIKAFINQKINFKLYGTGWQHSPYYQEIIQYLGYDPARHLHGEEYNKVLNETKIAIVFLSKLNNDTYTTRCFEIPVIGTMMLCERTADMQSLFTEDVEAAYFSSITECINKLTYYLDQDRYIAIANQGFKRVHSDGHEAIDRCREILLTYNVLINSKQQALKIKKGK